MQHFSEEKWTYKNLRGLFMQEAYDRQLRSAIPCLREPDDHLPPAQFSKMHLEAGVIELDEKALRNWKRDTRSAFQRRAIQILQQKDHRTVEQWENRRRVLHELQKSVAQAKYRILDSPFKDEMWENVDGELLLELEKRVARTLAKYEWRLDMLRQEEEYRDAHGKIRETQSRTSLLFPLCNPDKLGPLFVKLLKEDFIPDSTDVEAACQRLFINGQGKKLRWNRQNNQLAFLIELMMKAGLFDGKLKGREHVTTAEHFLDRHDEPLTNDQLKGALNKLVHNKTREPTGASVLKRIAENLEEARRPD